MELKRETDKSIIIVGMLNTSFIFTNRTDIQKQYKYRRWKNINHYQLIDINIRPQKNTFLSNANRTLTKVKHVPR